MNRRRTIALAAVVIIVTGLALIAFTAGTLVAQTPSPPSQTALAMTHEQMHQMMDAMHGEGTSQRMHEAMGEDAERMMDQCVAMMSMMSMMQGMMGGQNGQSMPDMMRRMMGR